VKGDWKKGARTACKPGGLEGGWKSNLEGGEVGGKGKKGGAHLLKIILKQRFVDGERMGGKKVKKRCGEKENRGRQ